MSRSAEEQLLLDQRIQAMKEKNEALRRRHLEVEADKQSAAKQNALVKMNAPHDDDWVPGRHDDNPRQERSYHKNDPSSPSNPERHDDKGQWFDQRRRNEGRRDDGLNADRQYQEVGSHTRPSQNSQNFFERRNDYQGNRQRSDGDRSFGNENRRSGDWSNRSHDGSGGRPREWAPQSNRGYRNNASSGPGDAPRGYTSTFTSKVYKNSSMDQDRGKRPAYRLAEGDGPPPDPSYSFLGDSMRDSPESGERRRGYPRRGFPRGRGRGGQTWNNRGVDDPTNGGGETQPRHHEDPKHDEWRRERTKIDQERINRQKTSDGNWSREWDSNKVLQEGSDRPNRWRRGNQTQNYSYGQSRRGHQEDAGHVPRQNYTQRGDPTVNSPSAGNTSDDATHSPSRNKLPRRGRFTHQQRFRDNSRFSNGSAQLSTSNEPVVSKESDDAALIEANVKSVEQLQVSLVCDPSGAQIKRSVEGVGGNLRISLSNDGESSDSKNVEQKRPRKSIRKGKRSRILSSTSTGTTETAEEDDGSWEDLTSDEDVSVLMELGMVPRSDMAKSVDVSSGPESLDPIPAPGKEDEFLWDDFHPAGFQDNITLNLEAEAAYQALLGEQAKQVQAADENIAVQPHQVSFRLDTSCLEDSSDELEGSKLDPLLVTTQIVQAEVDCMSLTSIMTDTSLPDEVFQFSKVKAVNDDKTPEEAATAKVPVKENILSAEELSGPVSVLDVPSVGVSTVDSNLSDRPMDEEKSGMEHSEAVTEKPNVKLEAAAVNTIATSEVKDKDDSVNCGSGDEVKDELISSVAVMCESEMKLANQDFDDIVKCESEDKKSENQPDNEGEGEVESKEVTANVLNEQEKRVEAKECIQTGPPCELESGEKSIVVSAPQSVSDSISEDKKLGASDVTSVDPTAASLEIKSDLALEVEPSCSDKSPQGSEEKNQIVTTNPTHGQQEQKVETSNTEVSHEEPRVTCEKTDEDEMTSDGSITKVNDA